MATYLSLVNELLRRLNEVTLDLDGDGFDSVRNVQALAKDAINNSIRTIVQDGQEWPFLKVSYTQTLTAGTSEYAFPADYSSADWETFYLNKLESANNTPSHLPAIAYDTYIQKYKAIDETGDNATPVFVYQTNESKFGVTPIPNAAYEIEYVYWKYPTDMSLYTDVAAIPDRFRHVVIDGAMMYMMRFRSNEQSAAMHQQNFENGIKAMRRVLIDEPLRVRSTVIDRPNVAGFSMGRTV